MNLQPKPVLVRKSPSRLDYAPNFLIRVAAGLAAAAAFFLGQRLEAGMGRMLWFLGAAICVFTALSEDRWSFWSSAVGADNPGPGATAKRRFGIIPFTRSWDLPAESLSAIELRAGAEGDSGFALADERRLMEATLLGMGRGPWCALVLVLDDGRFITLASGKPGRKAAFRADGEALSAHLGLPFVDASCADDGSCVEDDDSEN